MDTGVAGVLFQTERAVPVYPVRRERLIYDGIISSTAFTVNPIPTNVMVPALMVILTETLVTLQYRLSPSGGLLATV